MKIIAFGMAADLVGGRELEFDVPLPVTADELLVALRNYFPRLNELPSLRLAVNETYAEADTPIREGDEVVLIPPVSGG